MKKRLPPEWQQQDAVLLSWPHAESDWAPILDAVEAVYDELIGHLLDACVVVLVVPEQQLHQLDARFAAHPWRHRLRLYALASNDTWARDFGPLAVTDGNLWQMLDFTFNGWGEKYPAALDNCISRQLQARQVFATDVVWLSIDWVLEGGAVEVDGNGSLLTTRACLLNPNRNAEVNEQTLNQQLCDWFGVSQILWLDHGHLLGDDTDSHIDTLARFTPANGIVYSACDDPDDPHYQPLQKMAAELEAMRNVQGQAYELFPLPWPQAVYDDDGERLPATYANFLINNGRVLVPIYNDPADSRALAVIADAFPTYEVIGIDCSPLIIQHGSLHCITMQLPKGVLRA